MDEILIEEKRYISSKQAAKLTGYAKDYVGQLCREGRVPARLVGRSWYVLESAISDHRFGSAPVEPVEKRVSEEPSAPLSAHFSAPRYVSTNEEVLPSINKLITEPSAASEPSEDPDPNEQIQESWGAWFDRVDAHDVQAAPTEEMSENLQDEALEEENEEVNVPVRAIHHSLYQPTIREEIPVVARQPIISEREVVSMPKGKQADRRVVGFIQLASLMLAAAFMIFASMGTGYFDDYIISHKQVAFVAGVTLYNK